MELCRRRPRWSSVSAARPKWCALWPSCVESSVFETSKASLLLLGIAWNRKKNEHERIKKDIGQIRFPGSTRWECPAQTHEMPRVESVLQRADMKQLCCGLVSLQKTVGSTHPPACPGKTNGPRIAFSVAVPGSSGSKTHSLSGAMKCCTTMRVETNEITNKKGRQVAMSCRSYLQSRGGGLHMFLLLTGSPFHIVSNVSLPTSLGMKRRFGSGHGHLQVTGRRPAPGAVPASDRMSFGA